MTRREEQAAEIRPWGRRRWSATSSMPSALSAALAATRPEVVVHALTALPPKFDPKADYLAATNRVRGEGTRNLVAAAQAAGARRIVAESVAFFYEPEGDWVKDEEAPLFADPPGHFAAAVEALRDARAAGARGGGDRGRRPALRLVLRARHLLRPRRLAGRGNAEAALPDRRQRRPAPSPSSTSRTRRPRPSPRWSMALPASTTWSTTSRRRCASGCRSTPRRSARSRRARSRPGWRGWSPARPWPAPRRRLRGATNAKAKRELGWEPGHPSWRQGFAEPRLASWVTHPVVILEAYRLGTESSAMRRP